MSGSQNSRRSAGRPFRPGQSGNPGGRPRAVPGFTARAKELSIPVLENMARIATMGRGPAAVQAGALVLAYGEGKPVERVDLTARRAPDGAGGNPDAARQRIEALIAGALTPIETAKPDEESGVTDVDAVESGNDVRTLPAPDADVAEASGRAMAIEPPDEVVPPRSRGAA